MTCATEIHLKRFSNLSMVAQNQVLRNTLCTDSKSVTKTLPLLCWMGRHTNGIEDPYLRTQWKHCKQNLTKAFHIVRLLDAEPQVFRDVPSSPKYMNNKNHFTAISPLRTRPHLVNNFNGDKGHYNIPGSSPFARPIVIFSPLAIQCGFICVM